MIDLRTDTPDMPIKDRDITVLEVGPTGQVRIAQTTGQKRQLGASFNPDAKYIAIWPGRYSSDAFDVTARFLAVYQGGDL